MKRKRATRLTAVLIAVAMVLVFFPFVQTLQAKIDYGSYSGFVVDETPVLPAEEVHPALWFDHSGIAAMYAKRNADSYAAELWESISNNRYLSVPLPDIPACAMDNSVHAYYGDMARIAKYNAFMFVMEGNAVHKQRATEALKRAYDGPIYDCSAIDPVVSSSPIDEIYRANWAQNFAAAYDWMQVHLSPADDAAIRDRLAYEAQILYENIWVRPDKGWGPRPHNHRSKPAWGLGSLALALSGYSHASMNTPADWLEEALVAANSNLSYFFSSDGIYREGSQYYIFSHMNFVPFLYHYKNVSGVDHFKDYKPAFIWEFHVSNNKGWMPNFADSFLRHNFLHMVASQYMSDDDATPLHPTAKWGNLFQWRYFETDTSPWGGEFGNNTGASYDDTMDLDKYLTYDPAIAQIKPTGSGTHFFLDGGQTIFRNHWNVNDPSSRYLFFHGVAEADNHNHFDHLSFVIHAENQMMASDSGYSQSAYGDAIRRTWYRTAPAHNTATLDGYWPVDMAQNQTPESKYSIDTDFFDFQQKSARFIAIPHDTSRGENPLLFPPDSESLGYFTRAIAFPGQEYFVVADQLHSKDGAPRDFSIYLHGGKGTMSGTGNFRQWVYGNDRYGSSAKLGAWIFSDDATLTDHLGEVTYVKDDYTLNGYVEASKHASTASFMQVLIPMSITASLPTVTDLSDSLRVGGTVEMDGNLDTFVMQQGAAEVTLGELQTDASFAYVRSNGLVQHYSAREATALQYQGGELFRSSERITLAIDISDRARHTGKVTTEATDYSLSLIVPAGKQVNAALVNNAPAVYTENGGMLTLDSLSGDSEIIIEYADSSIIDTTPPGDVTDLAAMNPSHTTIELQWTAPGNDGNQGTAAFYDLRYSMEPITEANWEEAAQVTGEPLPLPAGTRQSMVVKGLRSDTTYYFALRTGDESLNLSNLSNVATIKTLYSDDTIPPADIMDLELVQTTTNTVTFKWTAPGNDDHFGTAAAYDIRYSTRPINEANWHQAIAVSGVPQPEIAGSIQSMTVQDLKPGRTYFFAMKTSDESGNESGLSNIVFVSLLDDEQAAAKQPIIAVTASSHDGNIPENAIDGDFSTRWSAQSQGPLGNRKAEFIQFDVGAIRSLSYIKLAYHNGDVRKSYFDLQVSTDGANWSNVLAGGETSGMTADFETFELADADARYVRLLGYGNHSSGWNSITEVEIYGSAANLPDITVGTPTLTDWEGNAVDVLLPSGTLSVNVPVTNNRDSEQKVTIIVGLYNNENRLTRVTVIANEIEAWETEHYTAAMKLPDQPDEYAVKVFVWEDLAGMKAKSIDIRLP